MDYLRLGTSAKHADGKPLGQPRDPEAMIRHYSLGSLVVTWLASGAALLLGILTYWTHGGSYDPVVALTACSVIGLAWYTYFTRQGIVDARLREQERADQRTRAVATAVVAEMASLAARLRNLAETGASAGREKFIAAPALEHACSRPELFSAQTVQALMETRRRISDVELFLSEYERATHRRMEATDGLVSKLAAVEQQEHAHSVRVRSAWAYNRSCELVDVLCSEGALMPGPQEARVGDVDEIPLAVNPFDSSR